MRRFAAVRALAILSLAWLGMPGCESDGDATEDAGVTDPGTTGQDAPVGDVAAPDLSAQGEAEAVAGEPTDPGVAEVMSVGSATQVVTTLTEVRTLLEGTEPKADLAGCYASTENADGSLTLDFAACDKLDGTANVLRSGGVGQPTTALVTFEDDFAFAGRDVDGQLTLVSVTGKVLTYELGTGPSLDDLQPLTVSDGDGASKDITLSGFIKLDIVGTDWKFWGTGTSQTDTRTRKLVLGGTDEPGVAGDSPAAASLSWDLPRKDCYCPVGGKFHYETEVHLSGLTLDLDRFEDPDDGEDDFPSFDVTVDFEAEGHATLEWGACGTFNADFGADVKVTVNVGKSPLQARVSELCGAGTLSAGKCTLIQAALAKLQSSGLDIDVPDATLDGLLRDRLAAEFDKSLCQ